MEYIGEYVYSKHRVKHSTDNQSPSKWNDTMKDRKIDINDTSSLNVKIIGKNTTHSSYDASQLFNTTPRIIEYIPRDAEAAAMDSFNTRTIVFLLIFGICTIIYSGKC